MTRLPVFRTLFLCLCLIVSVSAAYGQGENLLTNPGFENPFEATGSGASLVAQGWTPWSLQTDQNVEPEYYPASDTVNGMATPRIHSGEEAQQYFSFFAPHVGGVYQQVGGVAAGDQLSFSVFAYVWVSSGDNADVSDGSGEVAVEVGIDPNGGTDPESDSIVWSAPLANYDQYAQYTISATAAGETVTAFVRSSVASVAMNNTVYLDNAELVVTGTSDVAVTSEPAATEESTTEVTTDEAPVEVIEATEVVPEVTEEMPVIVTEEPTEEVTAAPTVVIEPTEEVATPEETEVMPVIITEEPTEVVTAEVTEAPTVEIPTDAPTDVPTEVPTSAPTDVPPTEVPTEAGPTEVPTDAPPTSTPFPSPTLNTTEFPLMFSYTVVNGDTVGQLATRFGSTIEAIIIANQLAPDARIFVTQLLMIPVKTMPAPTLPPTETPIPTFTAIPSETPLPVPTVVPSPTEGVVQVVPVNPTATVRIAQTYTVQYGENLSTIATRFGIQTRDLARVNNIVNPNLVYVGQVLQIPASDAPIPVPVSATPVPSATIVPPQPTATHVVSGQFYQVQRGDNLYRISVRFNVPLNVLIEVNGILNPSRIFVGQLLIIPSAQ